MKYLIRDLTTGQDLYWSLFLDRAEKALIRLNMGSLGLFIVNSKGYIINRIK